MTRLGILGGGQLGRMTAMAAANMGIESLIFDPSAHCCAAQVSPVFVGDFTDNTALEEFAAQVDYITLEFENIPASSLRYLSTIKPMHPSADLLETCQDRLLEKNWLHGLGLQVAPFRDIANQEMLEAALSESRSTQFLKTRRFGYDGKGQVQLRADSDTKAAWQDLGKVPCILEERVDFACEVSLIIARNRAGEYCHLPLVENQHESLPEGGKILRTTLAPAAVNADTAAQAKHIGETVAEACDLVGILALEMFLLADGQLWINEMAPRPHNSGHWSMEGASISQFALLVRAACGLPLPKQVTAHTSRMENLLGAEADDLAGLLAMGGHVHIYGKGQAKAGRKMGHITYLN